MLDRCMACTQLMHIMNTIKDHNSRDNNNDDDDNDNNNNK